MGKLTKQLLTLIVLLSVCSSAYSYEIRNPQGRLGLQYKTETYVPIFKSNLSQKELEILGQKIEEFEQIQRKKEKISKANEKKEKASQSKRVKTQKELAKKRAVNDLKEKEKAKLKEKIEAEKLAKEQEKAALKEKIKAEKLAKEQEKIELKEKAKAEKLAKKQNSETPNIENTLAENHPQTLEKIQVSEKTQYQDYETKKIMDEIGKELNSERPKMLEELSALWVNAVQKSDTVYFAIMKLSNPNGEEVNKNGFKKILEPIIGAAPLVGQAFVNPALTAGSLIGSNVLGTMMNDNATKRLTRVNDADLVILARAIDELQETLLMNYMSYKNALKEYEFSIKITEERKKEYDNLNKQNSPHIVLANTFYTEALDNQYKARQHFLMKRVILEQMVGADALKEIEEKETTASNTK